MAQPSVYCWTNCESWPTILADKSCLGSQQFYDHGIFGPIVFLSCLCQEHRFTFGKKVFLLHKSCLRVTIWTEWRIFSTKGSFSEGLAIFLLSGVLMRLTRGIWGGEWLLHCCCWTLAFCQVIGKGYLEQRDLFQGHRWTPDQGLKGLTSSMPVICWAFGVLWSRGGFCGWWILVLGMENHVDNGTRLLTHELLWGVLSHRCHSFVLPGRTAGKGRNKGANFHLSLLGGVSGNGKWFRVVWEGEDLFS